jgi:Flagellar GTP-binding protein
MAELFSALIAADVDAHTAHRLISETRTSLESGTSGSVDSVLRRELEALCPVDANLGVPGSGRKIVALVGPPGCGKTTTLAKLAVQYGLVPRLRTQLLSIDMERIGAADQLRSLAFILGVGFTAVETSGALVHALEEHQQKELILIDTPGFGAREIAGAGPLAELLASREDIDVHLVLPASMKNADLSRTVDRFEIFRPAKLIFTRLDETEAPGCIVNELQRSAKSLSFLNFGQRIPEDLRPADPALLASLVLGERARKAAGIAA